MRRWRVLAWFASLVAVAVLASVVTRQWATAVPDAWMHGAQTQRLYAMAQSRPRPGRRAGPTGSQHTRAEGSRQDSLELTGRLPLAPSPSTHDGAGPGK